jgi:hypothetical protein
MDALVIGLFVIVLAVVATYMGWSRYEGFQTSDPSMFSTKPTLWWFVDDETNGRHWWDFGARNSKQPNRGYLQVALEALYATQAIDFNIQPLIGREAVRLAILGAGGNVPAEVAQMPATLWRQWALANLLAYKGGLAVVGDSTLCVGPTFTPVISNKRAAVFGVTADEPRVAPGSVGGTVAPAPWVGWAAGAHTRCWDLAADVWNRLAEAGPTSWSAAEARRIGAKVWELQRAAGIDTVPEVEGGRWPDGTERTLEDFLMRTDDPALPAGVVYVPMDGDRIVRDHRYGWFARMSRAQILESPFVWATLARNVRR